MRQERVFISQNSLAGLQVEIKSNDTKQLMSMRGACPRTLVKVVTVICTGLICSPGEGPAKV